MPEIKAFGVTFDTDNITTLHKIIIGSVVAVAILGSVGYYMAYPRYTEWQALEEEIEKKEHEKSQKEQQVKKLPELKAELKELQARLVIIRRKIPNQPNIAPLLIDLEDITENGLYENEAELLTFIPGEPAGLQLPASMQDAAKSETATKLKQIPIAITLENTTYPQFIDLIMDYENYERTLSVDSLTINPTATTLDNPFSKIKVSLQLKAFLLDDPKAAAQGTKAP